MLFIYTQTATESYEAFEKTIYFVALVLTFLVFIGIFAVETGRLR